MTKRKRLGPRFWRTNGRGLVYRWPIGEAADRLGITVEAARRRIRSGRLRGYKVNGQWYVRVYYSGRRGRTRRRRR